MFVDKGSDKKTVEFLKKSENYGPDDFERNRVIKLSGHPETLDKIEKMLAYMQRLGSIGHSTTFKVEVDGDGGFGVKCIDEKGKELSKKWLDEITNPEDKDIEYFDFS